MTEMKPLEITDELREAALDAWLGAATVQGGIDAALRVAALAWNTRSTARHLIASAGGEETSAAWRYSINYGPDGEANYANVFAPDDILVGNLRTHHAIAIVQQMNAKAFSPSGTGIDGKPAESDTWPLDHYKNFPAAAIRFALEKIEGHADRQLFLESWLHGHWELIDMAYPEWAIFISNEPLPQPEGVGLSASERACYEWPEDTEAHREARKAYIKGAQDYAARPLSSDTGDGAAVENADLVERIEAAICKAESWDREHYDANPSAKAAAVIAQSEYKRGWKEAQAACVEVVDKMYYPRDIAEKLRALPTPTAPSISKRSV